MPTPALTSTSLRNGTKVSWELYGTDFVGEGVVIADQIWQSDEETERAAQHVLVEVHTFPAWLGRLDGKFKPVIRCAATWLKVAP
jgi:hypothetical protein